MGSYQYKQLRGVGYATVFIIIAVEITGLRSY